MSIIKIENLTFSYPTSFENIFENVNLQIDTDWKLGFVGRNGRGKTTLLNLLLGKYEYSGKIISSVKFDYFPYQIKNKNQLTQEIIEQICPYAEQWEIIRELSYLEISQDVLYRTFETLSNGEQTKILLAALFLNEGHFFLFDEPTNHLDINARSLVSNYLKKKKGFILVSHDRHFIDECVDHILSLNKTNIEIKKGNLSSFLENFERQQKFEQTQNEKLKKDINRLQQSAKRTKTWSDQVESSKHGAFDKGYVGHKSAKMMKRSKSIQARQKNAIEQKEKLLQNTETTDSLKIHPQKYHSQTLATLSKVSICYDGKAIFSPVSFTIENGERIAISGKNGCGKSSILKLILGNKIDYTGQVNIASNLIKSYVPQNTSGLSGTLVDFSKEYGIDESLFKTILRKMDFERSQFEKNMKDFSAGQKKKVLIAESLCQRANLYIWDEPLNFIDIYSRMQIEQLIKKFLPTMIFVEHDKSFADAIATKIIEIS